jgi:ABC-type antimicrobial peptide transport system ATPase subunit
VAVMYAGRVVESGPVAEIVESPAHPYTKALLAAGAASRLARRTSPDDSRLGPLSGQVPEGLPLRRPLRIGGLPRGGETSQVRRGVSASGGLRLGRKCACHWREAASSSAPGGGRC